MLCGENGKDVIWWEGLGGGEGERISAVELPLLTSAGGGEVDGIRGS